MSVTDLTAIQRDPAKAIKRQLQELWTRIDQQARKDAEAARYHEAYAKRHDPNNQPPSAA